MRHGQRCSNYQCLYLPLPLLTKEIMYQNPQACLSSPFQFPFLVEFFQRRVTILAVLLFWFRR